MLLALNCALIWLKLAPTEKLGKGGSTGIAKIATNIELTMNFFMVVLLIILRVLLMVTA